jgi:hypothetical protein
LGNKQRGGRSPQSQGERLCVNYRAKRVSYCIGITYSMS